MEFSFTDPQPYEAAVARLESRVPVASRLRTHGWEAVPQALRDRAFFSAAVEDANVVGLMRSKIRDALTMDPSQVFTDRSAFVADMRRAMGAAPGDTRSMTDIASRRRLELIYDVNVQEANEYGRYKAGQAPELLQAFPARELIRVEVRMEERPWGQIWRDAGGRIYNGRMVARRDDPVWLNISRFGRPYPPFDFGSGMGIQDIDRDEAIELGVIAPDEIPSGDPAGYNDKLEASARDYWNDDPARAMLKDAFGDQIRFEHGKAVWGSERLSELLDKALAGGPHASGSFKFGKPSQRALQTAPDNLRELLAGRDLSVRAGDLWHAMDEHGPLGLTRPNSGEKRRDQVPLSRDDITTLNQSWMNPDAIDRARNALLFKKSVFGGTLEMILTPDGNTLHPSSIRKIRSEG